MACFFSRCGEGKGELVVFSLFFPSVLNDFLSFFLTVFADGVVSVFSFPVFAKACEGECAVAVCALFCLWLLFLFSLSCPDGCVFLAELLYAVFTLCVVTVFSVLID